MTDSTDYKDSGFPWFEEANFNGWLFQFRAHLRRSGSLVAIEGTRPSDLDDQGQPLVLNQAQRRTLDAEQSAYDVADNIAFADLVKACRKNLKTKSLSETGNFTTAFALMARLRARYNNISEVQKAQHLLKYHSLVQGESESGAEFVDREQKEYLALRDMGVSIDDSLRLTKFIQDKTTNSKHHVLAQTIYSTPAITLSRATSLFEGYQPAAASPSVSALDAFCNYCKKRGHLIADCTKRPSRKDKDRSNRRDRGDSSRVSSSDQHKKPRFPCAICDSSDHAAFRCPMKEEVMKCVKKLKKDRSNKSNKNATTWGNDEENED